MISLSQSFFSQDQDHSQENYIFWGGKQHLLFCDNDINNRRRRWLNSLTAAHHFIMSSLS